MLNLFPSNGGNSFDSVFATDPASMDVYDDSSAEYYAMAASSIAKRQSDEKHDDHICAVCKCTHSLIDCYPRTNLDLTLNSSHFDNNISLFPDYDVEKIKHIRIEFDRVSSLKLHHNTFVNALNLDILYLSNIKQLTAMPNLDRLNLSEITIQKSGLISIKTEFCYAKSIQNHLQSVDLANNQLENVQFVFDDCQSLTMLDLSSNRIRSLKDVFNKELIYLRVLKLESNLLREIGDADLKHLIGLQLLSLANNKIEHIADRAFDSLLHLNNLDLSRNRLRSLPSQSIIYGRLKFFNVQENPKLLDFPDAHQFKEISALKLHYSYHCCPFLKLQEERELTDLKEFFFNELSSAGDQMDQEQMIRESLKSKENRKRMEQPDHDIIIDTNPSDEFKQIVGSGDTVVVAHPFESFKYDADELARVDVNDLRQIIDRVDCNDRERLMKNSSLLKVCNYKEYKQSTSFRCSPEPDPFTPCSNLLEDWWLRISVWLVSIVGILSNSCVVIYNIIHSILYYNNNNAISVPTFLLTNLATADSLMSIYLLFIAVKDTASRQNFGKSALIWQRSFSCNLAGFLSVVSSVSSALCLAFITFERYYAIKNSINLNKRVSPKLAFILTTMIWIISLIAAALPLFELNDYSAYAICLPFDTRNQLFQIYLIGLNILLVMCFFFICVCYGLIFFNTV